MKKKARIIHNKLKELGHSIPLGHCYEVLAALNGDKSWNITSSKKDELICYRTIISGEHEFNLRMLPYAMAAGDKIEDDTDLDMVAIEIQVPFCGSWINFDYDNCIGSRNSQLYYFYNQITLKDFTKELDINLPLLLNEQNYSWFREFFINRNYTKDLISLSKLNAEQNDLIKKLYIEINN